MYGTIDDKTRYEDFQLLEGCITDGGRKAIKAAAVKKYGDPWGLTIAEFVAIGAGDLSCLGDAHDPTVLQVYWLEAWKEFAEDFGKVLEQLKIPKDGAELEAEACMKRVGIAEGMLVYARNYFGLPSFSEAEKITVTEYLMARRDDYNKAMYNRRLAQLRAKSYKKK